MRRWCSKNPRARRPATSPKAAAAPAAWKGNIRGPSAAFSKKPKKVRSWVDGARAANNPLLVEGTFRTGTQQHACLEPHAAVARFDGDRLTVHVSTQAVFHVMELIAKRYKLGHDKVRVIADHVGGGFGSKAALGVETTTAIELAREAKAPVRVAYDRHEELSVTGYRPATEMKIALLPSEQGELKALSLTAYADTGAATNSTIAALARLIYPAEAKELADFDVISNLPAGAPFRGPGGPPMAFALEQAIDEAALRMNVDPIALRKRWDPDPNRQRLYDWASGLEVWRNRKPIAAQSGRYRRGVGVATGYWLYLWQPGSKVEVAVKGGRLIASTATQDIGTGTRTVIANTVAREFGLEPHEIEVRIGDSKLPEGPGSGGSRVTASVIPPMLLAIEQLKAAIQQNAKRQPVPGSNAPWREMLAASPDLSASGVRPEDSKQMAPGIESPLKQVGFMGMDLRLDDAALLQPCDRRRRAELGAGRSRSKSIPGSAMCASLNVHTGIAVGKIAAPALARSQAAGAVIQGIGYALYEAREVDSRTGDVLSGGMEDYRIPGIADTPMIDVHFDEGGFDHVLGGSVGIGEVATVPTSPAVANAILNATGVRLTELPIRPDRLVAALKGRAAA